MSDRWWWTRKSNGGQEPVQSPGGRLISNVQRSISSASRHIDLGQGDGDGDGEAHLGAVPLHHRVVGRIGARLTSIDRGHGDAARSTGSEAGLEEEAEEGDGRKCLAARLLAGRRCRGTRVRGRRACRLGRRRQIGAGAWASFSRPPARHYSPHGVRPLAWETQIMHAALQLLLACHSPRSRQAVPSPSTRMAASMCAPAPSHRAAIAPAAGVKMPGPGCRASPSPLPSPRDTHRHGRGPGGGRSISRPVPRFAPRPITPPGCAARSSRPACEAAPLVSRSRLPLRVTANRRLRASMRACRRRACRAFVTALQTCTIDGDWIVQRSAVQHNFTSLLPIPGCGYAVRLEQAQHRPTVIASSASSPTAEDITWDASQHHTPCRCADRASLGCRSDPSRYPLHPASASQCLASPSSMAPLGSRIAQSPFPAHPLDLGLCLFTQMNTSLGPVSSRCM